jgi:DNA-binding transcriptional MocR family regulator
VRTELGTTPVLQRLVAHFVARGYYDAHLARVTDLYRARRDALIGALAAYCAPFSHWNEPEAGFYIWLTLDQGDVRELMVDTARHHVKFLAGPYFSPGRPDHRGIRLSYSALTDGQLEEGARRLGLAMAGYAARRGG